MLRRCFQGLLVTIFSVAIMASATSLGAFWVYVVTGHQPWVGEHSQLHPPFRDISPPVGSALADFVLRPGCT